MKPPKVLLLVIAILATVLSALFLFPGASPLEACIVALPIGIVGYAGTVILGPAFWEEGRKRRSQRDKVP